MHSRMVRTFSYAIYFCLFIFGMQLTMIGPLLESMSVTFGKPVSSLGILVSFSMAGFMIAVVGGGILADRVGKKKVIAIASLGFAFCLLLFSVSNLFVLSAALLLLIGGCGGILESLLSALIADIRPGREQAAVTMAHVFFSLGAIIGPALTGGVADSSFSWHFAYAAVGILAFISAIWLLRYPYPAIKPEERIMAKHVKVILRSSSFLMLCLALAIYVGVETSVSTWTAKYFVSEFDYTGVRAGLVVSAFWMIIAAGRLIFSWLSLRFSNRVLIRFLSLLAGCGFALLWLSTGPVASIVSIVTIGFGLSAIWPLIVAEAGTSIGSNYTGTSFGIVIASGGLGGAIIPVLIGHLSDFTPMKHVLGLLSLLMVGIAIMHHFVSRRGSAAK